MMSTKPITLEDIIRVFDKLAADRAARDAEEDKRRAALNAEEDKRRAAFNAEADKRRAEWEAAYEKRWEKHDKRMKALDERYGGLSKNIGKVVEHFFQKALRHEMTFGGIRYNDMSKNLKRERRGELQGEFDIVLHNGKFTGLIEVKHVFTLHHLHDFINRIVPNFRELCHDHTDGKTLYLGIASWAFEEGVIEEAKSRGIGILQRDGKRSIIIDDAHLMAY